MSSSISRTMRILCVLAWVCYPYIALCEVINPCEVVNRIDKYKNTMWSGIDAKNYPIAVCIAGYRHYDTVHVVTDVNGSRHVGIFGTWEGDLWKCFKTGDPNKKLLDPNYFPRGSVIYEDQIRCLANTVINSEDNMRFYQKVCQPHLVHNILCPTKDSGYVQVFDPIHKDLVDRIFRGETDLSDNLITGGNTTLASPFEYTTEQTINTTLAQNNSSMSTQKTQNVVVDFRNAATGILAGTATILIVMMFLLGAIVYFLMIITKNQKRFLAPAQSGYGNTLGTELV